MSSERRNELIAEIFHEIHWIEKWGRGISLILSITEENIYKLKKKGFLKRVGPARGGYWEVVEE